MEVWYERLSSLYGKKFDIIDVFIFCVIVLLYLHINVIRQWTANDNICKL
jgi:hypothetical protein